MSDKQTEQPAINKEMTIDSLFSSFPAASQQIAHAMSHAGLSCAGCQAATWETLEEGMKGHGKTDDEIDALVEKLNSIISQKLDATTIAFTPNGAAKFKAIAEEEGKKGYGLRLGLNPGGCSGFEYELDFTNKAEPTDEVFTSENINIYVHKDLLCYLMGALIDYAEGLSGSGFKISNPNVKSSCGCGSSQQF